MFHCFGCGVGGDVIKFVMLMEKMDFKECIQLLSPRYGIPLKFTSAGDRKEKEELLDLMRQAADYYHNLLTTHATAKKALDYLEETRRLPRHHPTISTRMGARCLEHAARAFSQKDVDPAMLEKCGLVVPRQSEGYYDRYRSRIIVPIHDIHGNIIGLGGRIFQGTGEEAKYLNSPETPVYSKSNPIIRSLSVERSHSGEEIRDSCGRLFRYDRAFSSGQKNMVASLGTSLTESQARLLRRYTDRVVLFYDPDTAGKSAD